ncbi:ATP-binding protein [Flavobacterium sp.]|uniref:sensor histidine kinase n=1 Tax=Flavobacterium sp. TaxID=239 RepID=UPI0025D5F02D|nr:ATP-binding protein [Flavobacterium sp.]
MTNTECHQYITGINLDITAQKSFSQELEHTVAERTIELEKMNKELQSFNYISSHDLQEPLRKIQTFSTQLLEKEKQNLTQSGKDKLDRMQNAACRMQTLINDLLAYSRTNVSDRKFENTDLNIILNEVKNDLEDELRLKNATIEVTELGKADIIPFQFRQMLHNLISNALKFSTPEKPPHIKIKSKIISAYHPLGGQKVCHISISDNGIGFEQHYSDKIFEVFQRLHGKEQYNGTGIGLAIVKKIVENHHGIITANGELNKGANFDIYIPTT